MAIVNPTPIPAAGLPLPNPADAATFSARKLEQLRWANEDLAPGVNAIGAASYGNALDAAASAAAAAGSAAAAANSASTATANVAAASNFKGAWGSLAGALAKPASVSHNGAVWLLLNDLADVATSQPGVTADWLLYQPAASAPISIAVNTTAVPFGTYLITAACTLTLPAAPQVGVYVRFVNLSGLYTPVVDPGTEKIRGVAGTMTLDSLNAAASMEYSGASKGWV